MTNKESENCVMLEYRKGNFLLQRTYTIDKNGITDKSFLGRKKHIAWKDAAYVGVVSQTLRTENMPGGRKSSRVIHVCAPKLPYKKYPGDIGYTLPKGSILLPYTEACAKGLSRFCAQYSEAFFEANITR